MGKIDKLADHIGQGLGAALDAQNLSLRLAILFGSVSRGTERPDSDIDVAILPASPEFSLKDELALQGRLARNCGREVDLVRIDTASTLLAWHIAYDAVRLIGTPNDFARFRASAALNYFDYAPLAERAALEYARAVREQSGVAI